MSKTLLLHVYTYGEIQNNSNHNVIVICKHVFSWVIPLYFLLLHLCGNLGSFKSPFLRYMCGFVVVVLGPTSRSFPQAGLFVFGPSSVHVSLIYCGYNIYLKTRHKT